MQRCAASAHGVAPFHRLWPVGAGPCLALACSRKRAARAPAADGGGLAVSMQFRPAPVAFIFVAQSNPVVEIWVRGGRERMGNARPYFRHEGMRKILAGLRKGEPLHLSPDMDFNREESIFVPFMCVQAATVPSLSRLSRVAGARVVPG